jgi:transcriptional regulator with XRE-family HTH domain
MATFPERLKELRLKNKLSQKALGEHINSSERSIQSYELEERKPTLDVITALADYFNVSVDYLLGRDAP